MLARAPLGIKPLMLADDGDRIGFASEIPSLLHSEVKQGQFDESALSQYFFGIHPSPANCFRKRSVTPSGEAVTIFESGIDHNLSYAPSIRTVSDSFTEASTTLRELITDAVEKRLMTDVPLGTFLSGGIDSSILTGVLAERSDDPVRTFTVGFKPNLYDETDVTRLVADYHDTDYTEYVVSPDDVCELIFSVVGQVGEQFADPSLIPTAVVARETSQDVKVALSGDGASCLPDTTAITGSVIRPSIDISHGQSGRCLSNRR